MEFRVLQGLKEVCVLSVSGVLGSLEFLGGLGGLGVRVYEFRVWGSFGLSGIRVFAC